MKKVFVFSTFCFILSLCVVVYSCFPASAIEGGLKFSVSPVDTLERIVIDGNVNTSPTVAYTNVSSGQINLYEYGFRYQLRVSAGALFDKSSDFMFFDIGSKILTADTFGTYVDKPITDFYYYLVSFYVGINSAQGTINRMAFASGPTDSANGRAGAFDFFEKTDTISQGSLSISCCSFIFSSRDVSVDLLEGMTLETAFHAAELVIYPTTTVENNVLFYMSDINFKFLTETDAVVDGINGIEDILDKNNQEMMDTLTEGFASVNGAIFGMQNAIGGAIDDQTSKIEDAVDKQTSELLDADADADPTVGADVDTAAGDLGTVENQIKDLLPGWNPDTVLNDVPPNLTNALTYIGDKLTIVLNSAFGPVIFFCLSFGLSMTLIGRSVR